MPLTNGTHIGIFEVTGSLGAGGPVRRSLLASAWTAE